MPPGPDDHAHALGPTLLDQRLERLRRSVPRLARLTDVLLVLATVGLLAVDLLLAVLLSLQPIDQGPLGSVSPFVAVLLGLLGVAAVSLRRTHLVVLTASLAGAAVVAAVAGWVLGLNWTPSFAALFALAVLAARSLRVEPAGTALGLTVAAGLGVAALAVAPMAQEPWPLVVLAELGFSVAVGIGLYQRWALWRRAAAEAAARSDERLEIARELHDTIGHYVTGIVVQAQAARHVAARDPDAAGAALERIEAAGTDALDAMRQVVVGLRTGVPTAPGDAWDDVDDLLAAAAEQGVPVAAWIDDPVRRHAGPLAGAAHRIIAESLTNVRKHGRDVTTVTVRVDATPATMLVTVHDDGVEAAPPGPDAYGLVGMRERAEALGGTLYAGPAPGGGWLVRAELPWQGVA
jgi:signal transduction histidine kinase